MLLPCLLAAFRNHSVGVDVDLYVTPNFQFAKSVLKKGFFFFYENMPLQTEIGFAGIIYIGALFDSLPFSFLIMQLLVIVPIFAGLKKQSRGISLLIGMLCYFFLFYNVSLSAMRGSIAMALLFYSFYYLGTDKYIKFWAFVCIGLLFHSSIVLVAVISFLIYLALKKQNKRIVLWGIVLFFISFYFLSTRYVYVLMEIAALFNPRYAYYLLEYMGEGSAANIPTTDLLTKTLIIVIVLFLMKKKHTFLSENRIVRCLIVYVAIGRFFVLYNGVFYEALRVAYYFDMFLILLVAQLPRLYLKTNNKFTIGLIVLLPAFLYWLHFIMIIGGYGTNVYKFA